jgi:phosphoribosyl 1,2-cyclic phosphate phosphodiesterase
MGKFLFLGTGSSTGVPIIGCRCVVCSSESPFDKRLRPSGLLRVGGKKLLIDVGPDFRQQALREGIDRIDGLLLTHTHYDHIAGIDELRIFFVREKKAVPCLLSAASKRDLDKRYGYLFEKGKSLTAQLDLRVLEDEQGSVDFLGTEVSYVRFAQAGMDVLGFRVGDFAYVSDIRDYQEGVFEQLAGVKTLVLSALKPEPSPLHLSYEEAVAFARRVGAERTWLTHLSHAVAHEVGNQGLPSDVRLGYDGLELEFNE